MGRTKGYKNTAKVEDNKRKREINELEECLVRDRKFFSNYTNEEFIEYELKRIDGITEKFLIKFLKKYGYIKSNNGTIKFDNNCNILENYSLLIDDSMKYCG